MSEEFLNDNDPKKDWDYTRRDKGGIITEDTGLADALLRRNNDLYRSIKNGEKRTTWNGNKNIKTTTWRDGSQYYIQREQMNTDAIAARCAAYRKAAEAGVPDPLAPLNDDGKLCHKWMDLPNVVEQQISDDYFGGMRWTTIKHDRTLKAQFYMVVQKEYPQYICYPHGKLPIPVDAPYPTKKGQQRFFQGR